MDVQRNSIEMNKYTLVEQFYKLMEEVFISKVFFVMEYDKNNPSFSPGSWRVKSRRVILKYQTTIIIRKAMGPHEVNGYILTLSLLLDTCFFDHL